MSFLRLAETLTAFLQRLYESSLSLEIGDCEKIVRLIVKDVLVDNDTVAIRHSILSHPRTPPTGTEPPSDGRSLTAFADALTGAYARLGADADRYSFIEVDFHHKLLAGLPAHSLALRPAHSRRPLNVTCYTEGFSNFVTSMTAPVASGWRVSPGGAFTHWKAPPFTAHAEGRLAHFSHSSDHRHPSLRHSSGSPIAPHWPTLACAARVRMSRRLAWEAPPRLFAAMVARTRSIRENQVGGVSWSPGSRCDGALA
jgi:hypothetical protein